MTPMQAKFAVLGSMLMFVKACFFVAVYFITKQIQKRTRAMKARQQEQQMAKDSSS